MGFVEPRNIDREEKWVERHARAVDHLINSREYRKGTLSYAETGHVPHDRFWRNLEREYRREGSAFNVRHPTYAGFFTAPARLGELPQGNVIFDVMRHRDLVNPTNFAHYHPFYGKLVANDLRLESWMPPTVVSGPPVTIDHPVGAVPEPATIILVVGGLICAAIARRIARPFA